MDSAATAAPQQAGTQSGQPNRHRHRGPRRGRGNGRGGAALDFRPASVAPASRQHAPNSSVDISSAENSAAEGPRSGNSRRGRVGRQAQNRTVNGRQFGGQLTSNHEQVTGGPGGQASLQGDAAVFVPGHPAPLKQQQRPSKPQPKRAPKSQAPDIATRTHEDIDHGYYECPICTSEVQRKSKVWSCHICWTVFHLSCIKKWATNEGSTAARQQADGEAGPPRQWRCPGCNLPKDELPGNYTCWCEKELEPRAPAGVPPHSCGQTCGRERIRKCPHPCQLTCHAGPCPPCTHMGPTKMCYCGKHEVTKRCSETDYVSGWSCGEVCGELMPCGEHTHDEPCHEGLCGACEVRMPARCYCGQAEKDILCCDRGEDVQSRLTHKSESGEEVIEDWVGIFDCGNTCGRTFDCGVDDHVCERPCHAQDPTPDHCPRSPDVVTHCSCGKTPLSELSDNIRQSCSDPIPSCLQPCGKKLACGHECTAICHTGDCPSCRQIVEIKCRCGRTSSRSICHQGHTEPPQCMRVCRTSLNCGRHACDERCCTGERKALDRQGTRRKQRPLSSAPRPVEEGFEAEHICTRQCGRLLKCGQHFCPELCHKGACGSCVEAIFDEISCHCGRTVLQPPLPCGTKPPPCRHPCRRPKTCGHPQVPHNCHQNEEACPKCPFLVEKRCMCGKHTLKNQPCWLQDVRCGDICGQSLKCGFHHCRKQCHRPGQCEDANGQACSQPCGKPKKVCGHPDEDICHSPFSCKEDKPCQSKIFITCPCQAQKQEMKCGASKNGEGNNGKSLTCNEECARLERNRKLALALNIDQSTHVEGGDHVPYSDETLSIFAKHVKWGQTQEREFRVFGSSDDEKRLRFKPMKPQERAFLHALANDFGFDSESMDPEPHRHVMIWKTPRFVSAPNKTLAEALRLKTNQRSATASANVSDNENTIKKIRASNDVGEPFNSFIIDHPRFGLTVDELRAELSKLVGADLALTFDIDFLPSDEVVLRAVSRTLPPYDLEQTLRNLKTDVVAAIAGKGYGTPQMCAVDSSLSVLRRESDTASGDGWSRVAAKKAAPRAALQSNSASSSTNSFAALTGGNKVTFAKKKPEKIRAKPVVVVDDWEAAEQAEEAKENVVSSADEGSHAVTPVDEPGVEGIAEAAPLQSELVHDIEAAARAPETPVDDAAVDAQTPATGTDETGTNTQDWASQVEEAGL